MTIAAVENDGHMDRRVGSLTSKTTNGQNETSGGFLKVIDSALLNAASPLIFVGWSYFPLHV